MPSSRTLNTRDLQLYDEILLLRVFIRRGYERAQRNETFHDDLDTLRILAS